jgi:hypothetical protein
MPIGHGDRPVPEFLFNSGFQLVDNVTILGVKITPNANDLYQNFESKIEKIINIKNFWSRFKLSLPGRIAIAKTFMLSQIGYLGCILTPKQEQLQLVTNILCDFVKGNLNVSKDRIMMNPEDGGVGMINVEHYLTAIQASWIKKNKRKKNR